MRLHMTAWVLGGLATAAAAVALNSSAQSTDPAKFLQEAIRGNTAEVMMGELAMQRGQSKEVRDYGKMLIDDHAKANDKATALAGQMKVTAPTDTTAKQKQEHDAMAKLSGTEFDTTFMSHMVQGHQEAVAKYSAQAQSGDSSKVTDYAKETLPTLREHLAKAGSIQSKLSDRSSSNEHGSGSAQPASNAVGSHHAGSDQAGSSNRRGGE